MRHDRPGRVDFEDGAQQSSREHQMVVVVDLSTSSHVPSPQPPSTRPRTPSCTSTQGLIARRQTASPLAPGDRSDTPLVTHWTVLICPRTLHRQNVLCRIRITTSLSNEHKVP